MRLDEPGRARFLAWTTLVIAASILAALVARTIRGRSPARPSVARASSAPSHPDDRAKRGALLYQVQCARCHGADGHGDGPDSADLRPLPRDFASGGWRFDPSPASIRKVIVEGIAGTAMYPMGGAYSPRELDALVEHVRSLAPKAGRSLPIGFEPASPRVAAPALEVDDLEGGRRTLAFDRSGKLTLLVFWGTSCAPCLDELPELARLADEFHARGLEVVPVCVDDADRGRVARALAGKFDRFPSYFSTDGMAALRYDIQVLPVAALIDRRGGLLGLARGGVDWDRDGARESIEGLLTRPD